LKQNIIGIIGGIMAFVSLALPWWTMTMSASAFGESISRNVSIYPYQATASYAGTSMAVSISLWYCWAALVLVLIGGLLGIVGSLAQNTRMILIIFRQNSRIQRL
jgi:hypothetical protein